MRRPRQHRLLGIAAVGLAVSLVPARSSAETRPPPAMQDIRITERLGATLPTEVSFVDTEGNERRITLLARGRPTVLVLAYVRCETLCNLVLRGVADAVRNSRLKLGRDYQIVTISIDPRETAKDSTGLRRALLDLAEESPKETSWHYLTGDEVAIRAVADAIGFGYAWDSRSKQYAHPAVVTLLDPRGRVMRYLYGARFAPADFDGALRAAARGEGGPSGEDGNPLACFRFDPSLRAHWDVVAAYFAAGGAVLILLVAGGIAFLIRRERRQR